MIEDQKNANRAIQKCARDVRVTIHQATHLQSDPDIKSAIKVAAAVAAFDVVCTQVNDDMEDSGRIDAELIDAVWRGLIRPAYLRKLQAEAGE